jgi:thiol-disulfide isomerase/thioredoxin
MNAPRFLVALGLLAGAGFLPAPRPAAAAAAAFPPTATAEMREDYGAFLRAPDHRAFAIAPGGVWGMATDSASLAQAEEKALAQCREATSQKCHLYAADDAVVFNRAAWDASWLPAPDGAHAATGTAVGDLFPDLVFTGPDGVRHSLADYRGEVVVLHFWASWCGFCQRELPDLARLAGRVGGNARIRFLPVQAREPIATARRWAAAHGIEMPLYDGGGSDVFRLADGSSVPDRSLAHNYPSTYVLDQNGVVVFRHVGPLEDWVDYLPLLTHLARAGRSETAAR